MAERLLSDQITGSRCLLSIVIPVLNEQGMLEQKLPKVKMLAQQFETQIEVIFVDGGSRDQSGDVIREFGFQCICSESGRARQMNAGAELSHAEYILFLHVDTDLPEDFSCVLTEIKNCKPLWGFFKLRLSSKKNIFRLIAYLINRRSALTSVSTGDQGQFFQRLAFIQSGGFLLLPLMEDIEIAKRFRKKSKPMIIGEKIESSSRRWEQAGIAKTVALMWSLRLAFWLGVDAKILARFYRQVK